MKIILIGIQGSGKSTQGELLNKKLGLPYISSGVIFREMAKEDSSWGQFVRETLKAGHLVPDDKTIAIITDFLARPVYSNGYILDGFPRTVTQAQAFSDTIDNVFYIHVSDEEALKRLSLRNSKEKREDDTNEAIQKRIALFHRHTEPVLDFYRKKGLLEEVNGERSIKDIHEDIVAILKHG